MFLSLTYYVRTYFLRESLRIRRTQNLLLIGSCAPHESFSLLPLLPMSRQDTDPETRTNFDLVCAWFALKPALSERQQRKQQKLIHPDAVVEYDEDYDQKSVVWESFEAIKQKTRVSLGELHGITDQAVFDEKAQEHNYNTARRVRRLLTKMIENQENAEEDKAKWPDVLPLVLAIAPEMFVDWLHGPKVDRFIRTLPPQLPRLAPLPPRRGWWSYPAKAKGTGRSVSLIRDVFHFGGRPVFVDRRIRAGLTDYHPRRERMNTDRARALAQLELELRGALARATTTTATPDAGASVGAVSATATAAVGVAEAEPAAAAARAGGDGDAPEAAAGRGVGDNGDAATGVGDYIRMIRELRNTAMNDTNRARALAKLVPKLHRALEVEFP